MSHGFRQGRKIERVKVDVNGVEILGNIRMILIRRGNRSGGVGKMNDSTLCDSMALNACDNWVSVEILLLKIHIADFGKSLDLVTNADTSGNGDRVTGNFALECDLWISDR